MFADGTNAKIFLKFLCTGSKVCMCANWGMGVEATAVRHCAASPCNNNNNNNITPKQTMAIALSAKGITVGF